MSIGYVYVLQNKTFGANVVKIGLTTRAPDVRAREIYVGASGVPVPFDIAVAYSVSDCVLAEKRAHKLLRVYRLNFRREFFRLSPATAASVVHQVCIQVNQELGSAAPERFDFPTPAFSVQRQHAPTKEEQYETDGRVAFKAAIDRFEESPVGTSTLSEEQIKRAEVLFALLTRLNPVARDKWFEGFTRDHNPERELRIWEHMAKAYLTLEHADEAPEKYREEAFTLLLKRTWSSSQEVLAETQLTHFSRATAKRLLDAYELRPKPVVVRRGKGAA